MPVVRQLRTDRAVFLERSMHFRSLIQRCPVTFSLLLLFPVSASAQSPAPEPTYWQDIRPIFRKHCTACHSTKNLKEIDVSGGLALDNFEATKKGSKRPVVVPGASAKSL